MSTNKSNLDTNDSPTQSEKTSSQANNDSTDNQSAPSKQLDSKPSEQKVYKTKFNDEPTQDVDTTTKLKHLLFQQIVQSMISKITHEVLV